MYFRKLRNNYYEYIEIDDGNKWISREKNSDFD